MRNLNKEILQALENNQVLISLLGGKWIYNLRRNDEKSDTWITFSEINDASGMFADGEEMTSDVMYQVDIWSLNPITVSIKEEVKKTMKSLRFKRISIINVYEEDTKIYRYGMRFRTEVKL